MYKVFAFIIFLLGQTDGQCKIDFSYSNRNFPIIFRNFKIFYPSSSFEYIPYHSYITVLCNGPSNTLRNLRTSFQTLKCDHRRGDFVLPYTYGLVIFPINNKSCELPQKPTISTTDGLVYSLGVLNPTTDNNFISQIDVSFNKSDYRTYWTKHTFKRLGYYNKRSARQYFVEIYEDNSNKISNAYKRIQSIQKGHLTPVADFALPHEQYFTNCYINIAPQWKNLNEGNWKLLEYAIRRSFTLAEIFTGTHEVITYILEGRLPWSKYLWKVVMVEGRAVAFLADNNDRLPPIFLCQNICSEISWLQDKLKREFQIPAKGFIQCCAIQNFKTIPGLVLPRELKNFNGMLLT